MILHPLTAIYRGLVYLANSPRKLIYSYLAMIAISAVLYSYFEHASVGDSLWWAVVTASTVGYGDISPQSLPARLMAALLISVMVLLVVPLITAHFASKLIVDSDAFHHEEQEELKANLRRVRELTELLAQQAGISAAGSADPPAARSDR